MEISKNSIKKFIFTFILINVIVGPLDIILVIIIPRIETVLIEYDGMLPYLSQQLICIGNRYQEYLICLGPLNLIMRAILAWILTKNPRNLSLQKYKIHIMLFLLGWVGIIITAVIFAIYVPLYYVV